MDRACDSWDGMVAAVQASHDKHQLRRHGGEDLAYRIALMTEELGEIATCVTKGRPRAALAEELADLLILVMGTDNRSRSRPQDRVAVQDGATDATRVAYGGRAGAGVGFPRRRLSCAQPEPMV